VRPQAVAREAFRAGMAAGTNRTPESPPIAGSSTDDLKRQIAELTQAKNLIANTLDALQRIVNAQSHLDATVDELERAVATGENPGSGGESDSEDGVKAAP
jgi:hypothetical protein